MCVVGSQKTRFGGFTLIEILIVITLLAVFAAISTHTFANILKAQNKATVTNKVGQAGNYVLSLMEQQLRDSDQICHPGVDDSDNCVVYKGGGGYRAFRQETTGISTLQQGSDCSTTGGCSCSNWENLLDTDSAEGVEVSSFQIGRHESRVTISLDLQSPPAAVAHRVDFEAEVSLNTTVKLRGDY